MSKWTHPQGLAALIAGIYAALCPIWTTTPIEHKATYTMITLGVITAVLALFDLAMPDRVVFEGLIALMLTFRTSRAGYLVDYACCV